MCRIYIAWDFLFMGALESRHETELEGARSESRARRPPQTPPSGPALENRGLTSGWYSVFETTRPLTGLIFHLLRCRRST